MFTRRTTVIAILLSAFLGAGPLVAAPDSYPKTVNFYTTDPHIEDCPRLSKYDMVVMPAGMQDIKPEIFGELRWRNPDIIILAYFPAGILWPDEEYYSPVHQGYFDKVTACDWWLRDNKGNRVGNADYWWFLNFTTNCPEDAFGQTIGEWLASYMADEIYATGLWDGFWIDGCFENPTWINNGDSNFEDPPASVDSDQNGVGDADEDLKAWWYTELSGFVSSLRSQIGPGATLVGNGKQYMHGRLNGGIRENFPKMHGDWEANMFSEYGYVTNCDMFLDNPHTASMITCFSKIDEHTVFEPYRCPSYQRFMRFTLASALLGDGYYALEDGTGRCLWWEDMYDLDLGMPTSDAYLDSIYSQSGDRMCPIWRRDFDKGYVLCNPFDNYIYTVDSEWIWAEDGMIVITESEVPLSLEAPVGDAPTVVHKGVRRITVESAITNPSEYSTPAYLWSETRLGDALMGSGPVLDLLVGSDGTDTVDVVVRFPSTLELGTYTIVVNLAGPDMEVIHSDTFHVRRDIEFPSDKEELYDNQDPSSDTIEEDNLLIYPQPVAFSSGETLRMEVRANQASANEICNIRMFDVRGRLVRSVYEGVYGEGLSLEIGLTSKGGEKIAPGLYIIVLEMGDLALNRKIVLLK